MRLLVIGASGYAGRHVARRAVASGWNVTGTYQSRPLDIPGVRWVRADISEAGSVRAMVRSAAPDAIVQAAYGGAPAPAPIAPAGNWPVNAAGAVHVARAAAETGARLVHVSSDAVHAGRPERYTEADDPAPVNPYGAAKAAAELGVTTVLPSAAIGRVSLIAGDPGGGGEMARRERFMLGVATGTATGALFTDYIRCPVPVTDVAAALLELSAGDFAGVLNIAGPDAVSFYDFAVLVANRYGAGPARLARSVIPDSGRGMPGNVQLDCSLAAAVLRTRLRGIHEVLAV